MKDSDTENLFREFPPVSAEEWEEKIRQDLKGDDYVRKLVWNTQEGFPVKPYYRVEDLSDLGYLNTLPGEFPFLRGFRNGGNDWTIRQDIPSADVKKANQTALDAIDRGAGAIGFNAREITTHRQMRELLDGIDLSVTAIHFFRSRAYPHTTEILLNEIDRRGIDPSVVSGSINFDPIAYLLAHGDFYISHDHNIEEAAYLMDHLRKKLPRYKVININGYRFQDSGSTLVQELAFALATGNEYLAQLTERGFSVDDLTGRISFTFALGPSYFLEIAKLRAARLLWSTIVGQYHPEMPDSCRMDLHGMTARWNKTLFDPYVNMLRTTTECMSGALGNVNTLAVMPFDIRFESKSPLGERIARNQQLILKEEAYLDTVVDPAAGSYFIESLTESMASHAWALFLRLEEMGGMIEAVKQGFIQDGVAASRLLKESEAARRRLLLLGTNQYPNPSEQSGGSAPEKKHDGNESPSTYKKMRPFRVAEPFEELRRTTERFVASGHPPPTVFLFTIGNLAMQRARAGFAANFFGCAGYRIIDNPGFRTVGAGCEEALTSDANVVVICSSDDEYALFAPEITRNLKACRPSLLVVVAGYPATILEELKQAGVDGFIHLKSNLLEELQDYQHRLGVK